jgi:Raf kinase inhibitor-like YbhB/YbcL family protein
MITLNNRANLNLAMLLLSFLAMPHAARAWETFHVSSDSFVRGGALPLSTINTFESNGKNTCTASGLAGGNKSPDLEWRNAPAGAKSFAIVMYDVTASFTHWGIYNISGAANGVPQNAGAADSMVGSQVYNNFGTPGYGGPCPPADVTPLVHRYVFTVYALDTTLNLPASENFPPTAGALYNALIDSALNHHVLGAASIYATYAVKDH